MEEAPVTAATGPLGPVVAKLRALLRRRHGEYQLRRGTRKDVKVIKSKLKSIHSILWVTWEREHLDSAGKELRMEAWRLADVMNDAIDDFILSMERSNDGKRFVQVKVQPSPFQDLKRRAGDVSERCRNKWKTETPHTAFSSLFSRTKSTVDDSGLAKWPTRVNDPYVRKDISELVGMEEPRERLIDHLVGEHESTPPLKMACILGAAGMGKTTLARLVFEAIQDKFEARAFVSVTSSRNMTELLVSILQQVTPDSTHVLLAGTKTSTKNKHLIDAISSFLKDKRYLVIIDDIWHCGEWEIVKKSLPDNNLGSRIVTTTRVIDIAKKWCKDFDALVYKIGSNYWIGGGFIKKMIDMNADMVGEGFDHDHLVVTMCGGMPLAVACMFSALAKKRERERLWLCMETRDLQDNIEEQVKRIGIQNTPGFEALVESLELGYNDLPHHMLKTCLLYCSIEDHTLYRDELVRRWIAQGIVCKEEVAKDYFKELVSRGFINEENNSYKLHPMMQNYLRCKLREHNFITCSSDILSSPAGRLCTDCWPASSDAVDDWHHIRSLVVLKNAERLPYKHLQHLRVLDVRGNEALENEHLKDMCGLLRLRHMFVSPRFLFSPLLGINEMPADIARLQYLETLEVSGTRISRLPAEIGDLKQLKTLNVSWTMKLAELPREMGKLEHILETLIINRSNIGDQAWEIIGTLKNLKTLDVSHNIELSEIPKDIGELRHLETLNLSGTGITELPCEIWKLSHLETLKLSNTRITELSREIGNLQRLKVLDLGTLSKITKLPREIGKLQQLESLDLRNTNVSKIPREIGGLKKLKNLDAKIGTVPFEAGQLPKLEGVPKCVQTASKNSDLISSLAGEILSFQTTNGSTGDGGLVVGKKHMHVPQRIEEHFNNIATLDIRICTLEERDLKILREMPYLEDLVLRFEAVPRKPISISGAGFASLSRLTVDSRVPRVTFQEGAMPRLWCLTFQFRFYGGVPNTQPVRIYHLVHLRRVIFRCSKWYRGDSPCINATIDAVTKEAQKHPSEGFKVIVSVGGQDRVVFPRPDSAETSQGSSGADSSEANEIEDTRNLPGTSKAALALFYSSEENEIEDEDTSNLSGTFYSEENEIEDEDKSNLSGTSKAALALFYSSEENDIEDEDTSNLSGTFYSEENEIEDEDTSNLSGTSKAALALF